MSDPSLQSRGLENRESNTHFLNDTDKVCGCVANLIGVEKVRSRDQSLAYFFSGRSQYFSELDSCLLSQASEQNYGLFHDIFSYDQIAPLIEIRLKELRPSSVVMVTGRYPAQAIKSCMVEKVLEECQKIRSLFFTYKCLKKRMKNMDFYTEISSQCRREDDFLGTDQKI